MLIVSEKDTKLFANVVETSDGVLVQLWRCSGRGDVYHTSRKFARLLQETKHEIPFHCALDTVYDVLNAA